jgi:hypothetical protein
VSSDRWRWAQKAQQLRFSQLDTARRQAEAWRTGLAGITALFGAVLVIKGRSDIAGLASPYPVILVASYVLTLILLLSATLIAIRAASGVPGDECLLTGEDLEQWTANEVVHVQRAIRMAAVLTVIAVCMLVLGASVAWLAPAKIPQQLNVLIRSHQGNFCGQLSQVSNSTITIKNSLGTSIIPLSSIIYSKQVSSCRP